MDTVHALLELQEHDLALLRLAKDLEEMPEKRAILTARVKLGEIEKLKTRTDAAVHAMEQSSKAVEDKIGALGVKMAHEQEKLVSGEIANPKELQSVSKELDALRRRVEALESELLAQMQKHENGVAQAAKIEAALVEGHRREGELTARFKTHGGEILQQVEAKKRERAALAAMLDPTLLKRYESTRSTRHGVGIGVLENTRCSACRVGLPAGRIAELNAGPDVATCPSCGRILIVRGA
jgi:predicted  nucleic acid-binding Zn-ribbon protein